MQVRTLTEKRSSITTNLAFYGGVFCLAVLSCAAAYAVGGYAPFGDKSVAVGDGFNQYLDFFAYLKELMTGNASAYYSFSKTLGGNAVAIFSYYLASPLNLLVVFFAKDQLVLFYHLLCALKMGLAAAFCAVFLRHRFAGRVDTLMTVLLSLGYGLCHYSLAQCRNVMWLDGVYMLPLILLGVWMLVTKKRTALLSVTVGLALLFNWYSGAVACLFSAMWLVLEWLLCCPGGKARIKDAVRAVVQYTYGMLFGIGLSTVLFWPSVLALRRGRASVDWTSLELGMHTNPLRFVLEGFTIGAPDSGSLGLVCLACGAPAVIGGIALFFSQKVSRGQKIVFGLFAMFVVFLFYWGPARFLFCLLKDVGSYWYRYSFVGSFAAVFLAAYYFAAEGKDAFAPRRMMLCALGGAAAVLVPNLLFPAAEPMNIFLTVVFLAAAGALLSVRGKRIPLCPGAAKLASAAVILAVFCEMAANSILTWVNYDFTSASETAAYMAAAQIQIDSLKEHDGGLYRIHQTECRTYPDYHREKNISINYNESLAYDYMSVSGFTSSTDAQQLDFFDRMGYNRTNENLCVTATPLLGADSILGVKYYISAAPLSCLVPAEGVTAANGRAVYENPYALPLAFRFPADAPSADETETNPFAYQNQLFGQFTGETAELYKDAGVSGTEQISENEIRVTVEAPKGNAVLYGILNGCPTADVYVDGVLQTTYQDQRAPTIIYVDSGENGFCFSLRSEEKISAADLGIPEWQLAYLDVDLLAKLSAEINGRAAAPQVADGSVRCTVTGTAGENLFLSVPYDSGWTITRNGETVQPGYVGGCLISVPLADGENAVEMHYRAPGFRTGTFGTAVGVVLVAAAAWLEKKKSRARQHGK